ncbi:unnamed protein product [Medioppia subpectinata]|uniref:limulus clotting factor C n=1 Tax=Medioppia subpectinata TaxID=1979941 RepID=A0A7R9KPG7_9ACAR|nr:unnamed protein product [Medioppia subpectinata]CAG2107386.1 unnamed protein product [Medioppia subpectinata]
MLYNIVVTVVILYLTVQGLNGDGLWKGRCGNQGEPTTKIMGGSHAYMGEWPWMVRLLSCSDGHCYGCGGSLISDQWVLTAAHCVDQCERIYASLGEHNREDSGNNEVHLSIIENIVHKDYNNKSLANDIALLRLSESLDLSGSHNHLEPICLDSSKIRVNTTCVATGWGRTELTDSHSILQKVELPIADDGLCVNKWGGQYQASNQVCAGIPNNNKDTCHGDSGGPLACKLYTGPWMLNGITSYGSTQQGAKCIAPPSVYTRVSAYLPWIKEIMIEKIKESRFGNAIANRHVW